MTTAVQDASVLQHRSTNVLMEKRIMRRLKLNFLDIREGVAGLLNTMQNMHARITIFMKMTGKVDENVEEYAEAVDEYSDKVNGYSKKVDALDEKISALERKVDAYASDLDTKVVQPLINAIDRLDRWIDHDGLPPLDGDGISVDEEDGVFTGDGMPAVESAETAQ